MKKIFALLLTLVLLVTPLTSLAAAPVAASYLEGPAKVEVDQEFEITYYLQGDEIRSADGKIIYNPARVDLVSVDLDAAGWIIEYETVDDGILFAVVNETGKRPISEKTAVFTVTLKARATTGTAGISAAFQNLANGKAEMVALEDTEYTALGAAGEGDNNQNSSTPDNNQGGNNNQGSDNNQGGSNNQGGTVIVPPVVDGPSKDFTLKSLAVEGYKLVQKDTNVEGFDPEVRNYVLTVPFSVEKLNITAEANSDKATIEITEDELIYVGTNITKIAVTAEDGSKRTYKIYTTRLAPEEEEGEGNDTDAPAEEGLGWLLWVIIGGAALLLALIIIIVIVILKKKKN